VGTNNIPREVERNDIEQQENVSFPYGISMGKLYAEEQICFNKNLCGCSNNGTKTNTPSDFRKIIEVAGKGLLNFFFCIVPDDFTEEINVDDQIIVKFEDYFDNCIVTFTEEKTKLRREKLGLSGEALPVLIRKVTLNDLETISKNDSDQTIAKDSFRVKVSNSNLIMKLVDIHFQFDRKKLFFFYTADGRVDFRALAKDLAAEFKTRIELRQIGVRDETKRLGGLGICGREFCCTAFINNFKPITIQNAPKQNYCSNFNKYSGPCGKLKCCYIYESD
jgi:cell fate regulator YaaT (PSP1 superfamily)